MPRMAELGAPNVSVCCNNVMLKFALFSLDAPHNSMQVTTMGDLQV